MTQDDQDDPTLFFKVEAKQDSTELRPAENQADPLAEAAAVGFDSSESVPTEAARQEVIADANPSALSSHTVEDMRDAFGPTSPVEAVIPAVADSVQQAPPVSGSTPPALVAADGTPLYAGPVQTTYIPPEGPPPFLKETEFSQSGGATLGQWLQQGAWQPHQQAPVEGPVVTVLVQVTVTDGELERSPPRRRAGRPSRTTRRSAESPSDWTSSLTRSCAASRNAARFGVGNAARAGPRSDGWTGCTTGWTTTGA